MWSTYIANEQIKNLKASFSKKVHMNEGNENLSATFAVLAFHISQT